MPEPLDESHDRPDDGEPDAPITSGLTSWGVGVVAPLACVAWAAVAVSRSRITVPWVEGYLSLGLRWVELEGAGRLAFAGLMLGLGVAMHTYGFWGQRYAEDHPTVFVGYAVGLLGVVAGALGLLVNAIWLG